MTPPRSLARKSRRALVAVGLLIVSPAAAQAQTIRIDGSTGTAALIGALGKAFEARSGIRIEMGGGLGTKARFEALAGDKIDIAMASHGLNVDDIAARGMVVHRVATTAVVFGVNKSVPVASLTDEQVCAIYRDAIRNWKDLGGPDLAIVPLTRPESEVDAEVVRSAIRCFKELRIANSVQIQKTARDMGNALAAAEGAVGMTTAPVVEQSNGVIKSVALNGVPPTEENVLANRYRMTRDVFLVTKAAPGGAVQAFIDYAKSAEGAKVIKANGAIAISRP